MSKLIRKFAGAMLVVSAATPAHAEFSFRSIPELDSGAISKLSGDGRTVVGAIKTTQGFRAALWSETQGVVSLGTLAGGDGTSNAQGVSVDGRYIVGRSSSANGVQAFLWSAHGGMLALGDLPGGGIFNSAATGVSNDGNVVVGYSLSSSLQRAFRWTPAGMTDIGTLGGGTLAFDVSQDGSTIVGNSLGSTQQHAFVLSPSTGMIALPPTNIGAQIFRANGVSADGKVVVGIGAHSSFFAFRWTASSGTQDLGTFDPLNPGSTASAVSADGNVVVGMGSGVDADASGEAFVWFPNRGMLDLRKYLLERGVTDVQGWRLSEASSISDDGLTVSGFGRNPQGTFSVWMARIEIDDVGTPPIALPAPPSNLSATSNANQVSLRWNDNSVNENGFHIERCQGKNCTNFIAIADVGANVRTYINSGLLRSTTYRYRVRAVNSAGASAFSNVVSVQTPRR